jgi:hypothetical protein
MTLGGCFQIIKGGGSEKMKGGTELIYRYSGACVRANVRACVRACVFPKEKETRNKKKEKEKDKRTPVSKK